MQNPIRVLIVINPNRFAVGLVTALTVYPDINHIGTVSDANEAITFCNQFNPDVVLMELFMAESDSISTIHEIHRNQPHIQIITLSNFSEDNLVYQARQAGAAGNIEIGDSADSIVTKICKAFEMTDG